MSFESEVEFIKPYIEKLVSEQESLIAKFIRETGAKPSEICLVEQATPTGRVYFPALKEDFIEEIK